MENYILSLDQGTTSTRAMLFDKKADVVAKTQVELQQFFPNNAWVEHDPEEIWDATLSMAREVLHEANVTADRIAAIGITNQRETTIIWEKSTGKPIYPAIVWQDNRTADICDHLKSENPNIEGFISEKTGLLIDSYFSATKIAWILDHVEGARERAEKGELLFGTVDTFLLWRLTNGQKHATDISNASRTMLFNIKDLSWDPELLSIFNIPEQMLPEVLENCDDFGVTDKALFGVEIPIAGMAGDQQAAAIGQTCFTPGMVKSTYGTGCFMLVNTGDKILRSKNRLLTTILSRINGQTTYAIEGSIFIAGAAITWLKDKLEIIQDVSEIEPLVKKAKDSHGLYLIPAFTGLGAPYWRSDVRGAVLGITRDTSKAQLVRAALEAVCFQTRDLLEAIEDDGMQNISMMYVDGGMTQNDWLLQLLADITGLTIDRPECIETTAMGAAFLAGLQVGFYESLESLRELHSIEQRFDPNIEDDESDALYSGWRNAVGMLSC